MKAVKRSLALALVAFCGAAFAQGAYPNKPVKLIDPYAPGGSTSTVSRLISQKFQDVAGQAMVVDYKPGAASNIGADFVAKSPADGYTLLIAASSLAINPSLYPKMPYDPVKDLAPVAMLIRAPNVLAVHPSLPVKNVAELIEYARANPGKLNYGSSGNGATNHLAMELFKTMAKVEIQHVPFKGGGEAIAALVSGQVQVLFNPATTIVPQHAGGRVRMLAVGSDHRVNGLDLPTISESGLKGFESSVWFGLFAPAGTPASVLGKLNTDVNRILQDKQVDDTLVRAGFEPVGGTAEDLRRTMAEDVDRWARVIKAANVKID
jgi:tripartite-type tricarboxylate transporter receptor subunit TctC